MYTTTDKQLVKNYTRLLGLWLKDYLPRANNALAEILFEKTNVPVVTKSPYQIRIEAIGSGVVIAPNLTFDFGETVSDIKQRIIDTIPNYDKFTTINLELLKYEGDGIVKTKDKAGLEKICSDRIATLLLSIRTDEYMHLEKIKEAFKVSGGNMYSRILLESAEKGYISCVRYIYTHIVPVYVKTSVYEETLNAQMQSSACKAGQLNVLKCINTFLTRDKIKWSFHSYQVAIQHNKSDCLQYMFDSMYEREIYMHIDSLRRLRYTAKRSNKKHLEYLSKIEKYYRENGIIERVLRESAC